MLSDVNWPSHPKRLGSQKDVLTPTLSGYKVSVCWSHSHSTWTYRSFVLYRRAANRLAIRCHTPAVSRVGMALHLFNKTKSRHFISHSITNHFIIIQHLIGSPNPEVSQTHASERRGLTEDYLWYHYHFFPHLSPPTPPPPKERWFLLLQLL